VEDGLKWLQVMFLDIHRGVRKTCRSSIMIILRSHFHRTTTDRGVVEEWAFHSVETLYEQIVKENSGWELRRRKADMVYLLSHLLHYVNR